MRTLPSTHKLALAMISTCLILAAMTVSAGSYSNRSHKDYATVLHVEPIYETVAYRKPRRECYLEDHVVRGYQPKKSATTPKVLGALIGGAIGNELGHNKSNKRVGAVAGAILGGSIASDLQRSGRHHHHSYVTTERVCHTQHTTRHRREITGYHVDYEYRGRRYSTVMDQHPGSEIRVAVDVTPLGY